MSETDYQSDVSDEQWEILRKLLPPMSARGRPPLDRRWVLNAILYVLWTGCQWRALPSDFPNWRSVYTVLRRWRLDGTWERIHAVLRERARKAVGKKPTPTAVIVDSQTSKTTLDGDERGYDAGKSSWAASGIWPSIRWAGCGRWWCTPPRFRIRTERGWCCRNWNRCAAA